MKIFPLFIGPDAVLGIPITSVGDGVNGPDLRTVTNATLSVVKPDGLTILTWAATIGPADGQIAILATLAKLSYPFTGTELDTKGMWIVSWLLNLADTNHWPEAPEDTSLFTVTDKWGRP